MARNKKADPAMPADQGDTEQTAQTMAVVRQAAAVTGLVVLDQASKVDGLARLLRYQGATDASTLENSAREAIRRIGMAVFELGGYLLLLREARPHGQFLPVLERLGLAQRAAQQYMTVTRRFANTQTSAYLETLGVSKMTELLVLDDEQIDELADFGQTGELKLDDVASMSVKQLRSAVRELRQDKTAVEEVLTKKNQRIDKLEAEKRRFAKLPPDEALKHMLAEANGVMLEARASIQGQLRMAIKTIQDHCEQHGGDRKAQDVVLAGLVGELTKALTGVRDEFWLPDVSNAADLKLMSEVAQWSKS